MRTNRTWSLWKNKLIYLISYIWCLIARYSFFVSSETKYIIKVNKNNTCIYNYTGVYYFLSEGENACR